MTRTVLFLSGALAAVLFISLTYGDYAVSPAELLEAITGKGGDQITMILWNVRMPRALLAFLVGFALAIAGVIAQAVMRNPLAEPSLLGINGGAALAAMILIVHLKDAPLHLLPWLSFAGAGLMTAAIYGLSWRNGTSSLRIILIGIGLNALAGAATSFLSAFGEVRDVQRALVWLAGSVYDSNWTKIGILFLWTVPPALVTWIAARELDLLRFGENQARSIGQRVNLVRGIMIALCAILSGAAVASAGLIGFIGLIAPHLARHFVGPLHGRMLPVAALTGGLLVMTADLIGRSIIAPAQLPAGLMTALIGAPFFAWLMWERRNGST